MTRRAGLALAAVVIATAALRVPLDALDAWLATSNLFPQRVALVGLSSVAAAALLAGTSQWIRGGRVRAGVALVLGGLLATGVVWALRYMLWGTFGAKGIGDVNATSVMIIQWGGCLTAGVFSATLAGLHIRRPQHLLLHGLGLLVATVLADVIVSGFGVDGRLMSHALYYQTVEIEVHQPVDDPQMLYGLRPGSRLGGEGPWGIREVSVNKWGARAPDYPQERRDGIGRILVFGGSTLYGAGVGNRDTTPAQLERILNKEQRTEVWNFGVCAFNTGQAARLAAIKLAQLKPDLIILMITNTGRRAFMGGPVYQQADNRHYFSANPFLYLENFPPTRLAEGTHLSLLEWSALYRSYSAWQRVYTDPDTTYADRADRKLVADLEAAAAAEGVPVLYVLSPSRGSEIGPTDLGVPADRWLDLNEPGREADYSQAHPAPAILREYAERIAAFVATR